MEYREVYEAIKGSIRRNVKDWVAYQDLAELCYAWGKWSDEGYEQMNEVLFIENYGLRVAIKAGNIGKAEEMRQLIFNTLLFSAPRNFDHYMQVLEYDRPPEERFYLPRRDVLKGHVEALQELADNKLDELFLSQPPRTGKSSLVLFFFTWEMGRKPEMSNLYCSVSDDLTKTFYKRLLEILQDTYTYHWNLVFPKATIAATDGDKETIDIGRKKGYPTVTCRSLYGSLNGSCDARNLLCADDLLSGIEEARNPARLNTAQTTVNNNLLSRAKESCKKLWIGTRWSLQDPIGNRIRSLETDNTFQDLRYKIINIPALNEEDESNFEYKYGVGFSTAYYRRTRAAIEAGNDLASWDAQFQGEPIEREGTVFTPDTMRYYNGVLPDEEPERIWAVCDPAFGGGDFVSAPIIVSYNRMDNYVVDCVYSKSDKSVTIPALAKRLQKHNVSTIDLEITKTTRSYSEALGKALDDLGYHCTLTSHTAPQNTAKQFRILDKAPDIRQHFIFRDSGHRSKEYNQFMQNIFSFKLEGKNQHDDAPDSMSMAADRLFKSGYARPEIMARPF